MESKISNSSQMSIPSLTDRVSPQPREMAQVPITEEESKFEHSIGPQQSGLLQENFNNLDLNLNDSVLKNIREVVYQSNIPINSINLKQIQREYAIAVVGSRDDIPSNLKDGEDIPQKEWDTLGFAKKKITDSEIFGPANSRAVHLEKEILEELRIFNELKVQYKKSKEEKSELRAKKENILKNVQALNQELDTILCSRKSEEEKLQEKVRLHLGTNDYNKTEFQQYVEALTEQYKEAIEVLQNEYMTTEDWRGHAVAQMDELERLREQQQEIELRLKEKKALMEVERRLDLDLSLAKENLKSLQSRVFPIMVTEKAIQAEFIDENLAKLSQALAACKDQVHRHEQHAKMNFTEMFGTERISK